MGKRRVEQSKLLLLVGFYRWQILSNYNHQSLSATTKSVISKTYTSNNTTSSNDITLKKDGGKIQTYLHFFFPF